MVLVVWDFDLQWTFRQPWQHGHHCNELLFSHDALEHGFDNGNDCHEPQHSACEEGHMDPHDVIHGRKAHGMLDVFDALNDVLNHM